MGGYDTKPPTWDGIIQSTIQASSDTNRPPRDDNNRAPIHAKYDTKPPQRGGNIRTLIRACCGVKLPYQGDNIRPPIGVGYDRSCQLGTKQHPRGGNIRSQKHADGITRAHETGYLFFGGPPTGSYLGRSVTDARLCKHVVTRYIIALER